MDPKTLILKNMEHTKELFGATNFKLPRSTFSDIRMQNFDFKTQSTTAKFLPQPKKRVPINAIAPAPIIDDRSDRGRQKSRDQIALPVAKSHREWYNYTVLTGHSGWVKCISVDKSNDFFVTASMDRMIKFWRLAECELINTLTGHTGSVYDVALSQQNMPYLYSCSDAKELFNWDLTTNTLIRRFFGHSAGVRCVAESPSSPLIVSGSRDSSAMVWDLRTQKTVFTLTGHNGTVFDVLFQDFMPHVVTASADATIRIWDLRMNKCYGVLTNHKKTVRKLAAHPKLWSFISASPDAILQWNGKDASLFKEFKAHDSVINGLAINEDGVMVSCGDDGTMKFWDFDSGTCFQETRTIAQPGSLPSECGIFDCSFDMTGTRLITCEADKTVKLWREVDENGKPY